MQLPSYLCTQESSTAFFSFSHLELQCNCRLNNQHFPAQMGHLQAVAVLKYGLAIYTHRNERAAATAASKAALKGVLIYRRRRSLVRRAAGDEQNRSNEWMG